MTWLDIGNGWRNIYLLSVLLQSGTLGLFCFLHKFPMKKHPFASFLSGVAFTPLLEYLWMLVIAVVWPNAPKLFIIGCPPIAAGCACLVMVLRRAKSIPALLKKEKALLPKKCKLGKAAIIAICFAVAMLILLLPSCIRMMSSMATISGGDSGEYMGLALRWCENRDLSQLLEKEETVGHYRGHSHFPSLELYMSYGLLHTGGEMGYPYDKAAFTGLGLLIFFSLAAYTAILIGVCGKNRIWVALGLLCFNLVPSLYESTLAAPRDLWRIVAVLWVASFLLEFDEKGKWTVYLLKWFGLCMACFTVMSAHVVCFIILPLMVVAWVLWRWLFTVSAGSGHSLKALLKAVGLAIGGALGTLIGFSGNIWCFLRWGNLSPFRLMDTFSDAPWYDLYMEKEFKLEETTTTVNFFQNKNSVLMAHATKLGVWGFRLAVIALIVGLIWIVFAKKVTKRNADLQSKLNLPVMRSFGIALMLLLTLLPVTGLLDTKLYSFSGSFLKMARYTLQWYMLCGVMICAFGASFSELWVIACRKLALSNPQNHKLVIRAVMLKRMPAFLCAVLCCLCFIDGTSQKGYSESFYRQSRNTIEDETILLDNGFRSRYALLMEVMDQVPEDEKLLITRVGYQYPLRSRAYLIAANNIVSILNLPEGEIEQALADLHVAAVASEPKFWDTRYFHLSTLSDWLSKLPPERIVETDTMRIYFVSEALYQRCLPILAKLDENK